MEVVLMSMAILSALPTTQQHQLLLAYTPRAAITYQHKSHMQRYQPLLTYTPRAAITYPQKSEGLKQTISQDCPESDYICPNLLPFECLKLQNKSPNLHLPYRRQARTERRQLQQQEKREQKKLDKKKKREQIEADKERMKKLQAYYDNIKRKDSSLWQNYMEYNILTFRTDDKNRACSSLDEVDDLYYNVEEKIERTDPRDDLYIDKVILLSHLTKLSKKLHSGCD